MTADDTHRPTVGRWQVRVVDHGAHRHINRYEVTLCEHGSDVVSVCGWHDTRAQADAHADRLRARISFHSAVGASAPPLYRPGR